MYIPNRIVMVILLFLMMITTTVNAIGISCTTSSDCEAILGPGSICQSGGLAEKDDINHNANKITYYCSNPIQSGCLQHVLPDEWKNRYRVCNSNDRTEDTGVICQPNHFDYMEIRIMTQNWESVYFEAWILQILLSEMLNVPTTLETGTADAIVDLYDPYSRFEFGQANHWSSLQTAYQYNDCTLATQNNHKGEEYVSCAHFIPEVWIDHKASVEEQVQLGVIEHPRALGALGQNGWFIPKFTAEQYPHLSSWYGLRGEENRQLLAEIFKRPTTWSDYCTMISATNCTIRDDTAVRPPKDGTDEGNKYYVEGFYTGYFRFTEKNNCTLYPDTCTGHFGDYPCGWGSHVIPQTYHLNIALESDGNEASGGYLYEELQQIWNAANATKSHVIQMYFFPEALYQMYQGSDAEFTRVTLPPPTQQCIQNRITAQERCDVNETLRLGTALGTCDDAADILQKVITSNVYTDINDPSIPIAMRSPAYELLDLFGISSLEIAELFEYWQTGNRPDNPREAACRWVAENMNFAQQYIPRTYPRVLQDDTTTSTFGPLFYTALGVGLMALLMVLYSTYSVYQQRKRHVMIVAQVEFLWILLAGLLTIACGTLVLLIPPTNFSCMASSWLINVGYTMELVPLIVKVAAINKLSAAAASMRRVRLSRESLFGAVALLMVIIVLYMTLWTIVDPPQRQVQYDLTQEQTIRGETIVGVNYYCSSKSYLWRFVAISWNGLLLFASTVLAFQMRQIRQEFNESQVLAMMIYSHFMFLVLRLIIFFMSSTNMTINETTSNDSNTIQILNRSTSLLFSVDTIATILIYFVPKFFQQERPTSSIYFSQPFHVNTTNTVKPGLGRFFSGGGNDSTNANNTTTRSYPPSDDDGSRVVAGGGSSDDAIVLPNSKCSVSFKFSTSDEFSQDFVEVEDDDDDDENEETADEDEDYTVTIEPGKGSIKPVIQHLRDQEEAKVPPPSSILDDTLPNSSREIIDPDEEPEEDQDFTITIEPGQKVIKPAIQPHSDQ